MALVCEGCDRTIHIECESTPVKHYELLKENTDISWYCEDCKNAIKDTTSKMKALKNENKILKEMLAEMKATLKKEIKDEIMKDLQRREDDFPRREFTKIVDDMEEKKKRCDNLVVFHLPESNNEDPKKREDEDTERMQVIFKDVLHTNDCEIRKSIRLGRKHNETDRPRPLLLKMRSEDQKWSILKKAKLLRSAVEVDHRKIFIVKDQTPAERELAKKKWMDRKRLNEQGASSSDQKNLEVIQRKAKEKVTMVGEEEDATRVS